VSSEPGTPAPAPGQPVTPAPAPAYSAAAPAARPAATTSWGGMAARVVVTLIGAAAMIFSGFLDWIASRSVIDLGISMLWKLTPHTGRYFFTTVGFAAIAVGLLSIVGLAPRGGWLTRLAGALGIVLFVLFLISIYRAPGNFGVGTLRAGPWVLVAGSVVALIGGFLGTRPPVWQTSAPTYAAP